MISFVQLFFENKTELHLINSDNVLLEEFRKTKTSDCTNLRIISDWTIEVEISERGKQLVRGLTNLSQQPHMALLGISDNASWVREFSKIVLKEKNIKIEKFYIKSRNFGEKIY